MVLLLQSMRLPAPNFLIVKHRDRRLARMINFYCRHHMLVIVSPLSPPFAVCERTVTAATCCYVIAHGEGK